MIFIHIFEGKHHATPVYFNSFGCLIIPLNGRSNKFCGTPQAWKAFFLRLFLNVNFLGIHHGRDPLQTG